MQCSLFGKLPARRDFIVIGAAREFLDAWEPWLQSAISSSRSELGKNWQSAFLAAPIWRFWLGADICGRSVTGAFMSSLDGIGRYFPLTLFVCADDNATIPPPELNSQDDWFDAAEELLLSTLDKDATFEEITARVEKSTPPCQEGLLTANQSTTFLGTGVSVTGGRDFGDVFSSMRTLNHREIYAGSTFWWTIGGDNFPPTALCSKRMPNPYVFSAMLTGEFAKSLA
jgi:type VI secretion system protein ImpM